MGFLLGCTGSSLLCQAFSSYSELGATFHCSAQASHYSGLSCSGAQALGIQASVVGARWPKSSGLVVVEPRLSCSMSCRIFSDQGFNPCPLHWQANSNPLIHQGGPSVLFFNLFPLSYFTVDEKSYFIQCSFMGTIFWKLNILPSTDANFISERKKGWKIWGFFLGYNHPQGCGTMVRCSECKASQSDFTTGWSWTSQLVFLSLSFLIYEMNLKVVPSWQGWCWEDEMR